MHAVSVMHPASMLSLSARALDMAFHVFAIDCAQNLYPNGISFACCGKPKWGARLHLHTQESVLPVAQGSEVHHVRKPYSLSMRGTHLREMMQCDLGPLQAGICSSSLASTLVPY